MIARRSASKINVEAEAICEMSTDLIFIAANLYRAGKGSVGRKEGFCNLNIGSNMLRLTPCAAGTTLPLP
ncbi:MAG TPA: hypothetical protein PK450_08080 [Paracoccaceae bacterium]|nr:hypothetical protein [Paracoccaceae bacterium]